MLDTLLQKDDQIIIIRDGKIYTYRVLRKDTINDTCVIVKEKSRALPDPGRVTNP